MGGPNYNTPEKEEKNEVANEAKPDAVAPVDTPTTEEATATPVEETEKSSTEE